MTARKVRLPITADMQAVIQAVLDLANEDLAPELAAAFTTAQDDDYEFRADMRVLLAHVTGDVGRVYGRGRRVALILLTEVEAAALADVLYCASQLWPGLGDRDGIADARLAAEYVDGCLALADRQRTPPKPPDSPEPVTSASLAAQARAMRDTESAAESADEWDRLAVGE